jgi:ligand-binding sensor domain-containing protein
VGRFIHISFLAPLLAALLGGCVNGVAVAPEEAPLFWRAEALPARYSVASVAIDPEGRIFLAASDYSSSSEVYGGSLIFLSSDNGDTWTKQPIYYGSITDIASDLEGRIFAATREGILRSSDHGESWETLESEVNSSGDGRLLFDSSDGIYLWTWGNGIYFSGDHGGSWTQIGEGIPAAGGLQSFDASANGTLFAIVNGSLMRSRDRGASWTALEDAPWQESPEDVATDSGNRVFVNTYSGLYRSSDGGETWTATTPLDDYSWRLYIDGRDRLYNNCGRGLYVSEDRGESWTLILSLVSSSVDRVASNTAGDVFATGSWGLSRSTDRGASWTLLGFSGSQWVDITVGEDGTLYLGLQRGGIHRSAGASGAWERFDAGFPAEALYCLERGEGSILIAGTGDGIYASREDRAAWSRIGFAGHFARRVFVISRDSIAAFENTVWLSIDGGATWRDLGLNGYDVRALVRAPDGDLLAGANFGGVFRYTGEGTVWDQANDGLNGPTVNALVLTRFGDIIAGTDAGMFISSDDAASWRPYCREKPKILSMLFAGEDLVLGTDHGVLVKSPGEIALTAQNEGIWSYDRTRLRSLAAGPSSIYFLGTYYLYATAESGNELRPLNP